MRFRRGGWYPDKTSNVSATPLQVNAVRLKSSGSATFSNRYVKTKVLETAEQAGESVGVR